jgi:hypothetical protein
VGSHRVKNELRHLYPEYHCFLEAGKDPAPSDREDRDMEGSGKHTHGGPPSICGSKGGALSGVTRVAKSGGVADQPQHRRL